MSFARRVPSAAVALAAVVVMWGWPTSVMAQGLAPAPILVQSSRFDVILGAAALRDPVADRRRMSLLINGCRRTLTVADADSAAAVNTTPEVFRREESGGRTVIVLSVLATEGLQANCGDRAGQGALAASRGLRLSFDTSYVRDRDVDHVVVRRGDRALTPIEERTLYVRRLGVQGFGAPRSRWIRLAFDIGDFAPAADGVADDVRLEVHSAAGGEPDRFALPWSALRSVWEEVYAERIAGGATASAPMRLPEPSDEVLHAAYRAYDAGDLPGAIRLAAPRLDAPNLTPSDERQGRVQLGLAFLALGDTAAARVALGHLVETDPCFTLAGTAPAGVRAVVDALRRPARRCTSQSMLVTAGKSAVMPGFGRPTSLGDRAGRFAVAAVIVASSALAVTSGSQARDSYAEYVAFQMEPPSTLVTHEASALYGDAESLRARGKTLWTVAAVLYGGQLVESLWREREHARALERVREYGRDAGRRVGLQPRVGPADVGLSLSFAW